MFLQIATPRRERVEHYPAARGDRADGRPDQRRPRPVGDPVALPAPSLPREELTAFYLAADVMLVTPLRDGMNLVAKEYIACRHDDAGVLVLRSSRAPPAS